jgi:hypothetical protein
MRYPKGFSLLAPLNDFVSALGLKGPEDIYKEAVEKKEAAKKAKDAEEAAAAAAQKTKEKGIDIQGVIKK